MQGPWNLLSRGPPNQIKRSPQPIDSYLCTVSCLMSLGRTPRTDGKNRTQIRQNGQKKLRTYPDQAQIQKRPRDKTRLRQGPYRAQTRLSQTGHPREPDLPGPTRFCRLKTYPKYLLKSQGERDKTQIFISSQQHEQCTLIKYTMHLYTTLLYTGAESGRCCCYSFLELPYHLR